MPTVVQNNITATAAGIIELASLNDLPSNEELDLKIKRGESFHYVYNDTEHNAQVHIYNAEMQVPAVEIIGRFEKDKNPPIYKIRYVRTPKPIILENLAQYGVSINGQMAASECELPSEIHAEILQRAVELAKVAWEKDFNAMTAMGQRSE